ncbi:GNAT family N-acetyltransferase [Cytobacillus sp. FJAT-54145]|uniref:GNAT family N-acetyltransferase n=1 Tax=Cytobacillus spartinae TaxID=3299023 RepID=A0ABW6KL76_9BACI
MEYVHLHKVDKEKLEAFFREHWGSSQMVISSGVYQCDSLPGYACLADEHQIIGLVTYVDREGEREIISLDSIVEKRGIGSNLMELVESEASQLNIPKITLITSNDNIDALKFYQKRGYRMMAILKDAIEKARIIKPEIPLVGFYGIPIKDEILLEKPLR